jgi:cation transport regulator ChaB
MKYEDLPEDVKADLPQMLQDIANGVRTQADVAQEILSRT